MRWRLVESQPLRVTALVASAVQEGSWGLSAIAIIKWTKIIALGMFRMKWPWQRKSSEWEHWLTNQLDTLNRGEEIIPPWIAFPDSEPWWGGWRQGNAEGWLILVWLPFWRNLDNKAKADYVEKWDASADWREYLLGEKSASEEPTSLTEHVLNLHKFE